MFGNLQNLFCLCITGNIALSTHKVKVTGLTQKKFVAPPLGVAQIVHLFRRFHCYDGGGRSLYSDGGTSVYGSTGGYFVIQELNRFSQPQSPYRSSTIGRKKRGVLREDHGMKGRPMEGISREWDLIDK